MNLIDQLYVLNWYLKTVSAVKQINRPNFNNNKVSGWNVVYFYYWLQDFQTDDCKRDQWTVSAAGF